MGYAESLRKKYTMTPKSKPDVLEQNLAWKIKEKLGDWAEVILEYPQTDGKKTVYIDLCVIYEGKKHFIALKYKTTAQTIKRHGVELSLKNQGAHDNGRYDSTQIFSDWKNIPEKTLPAMFCFLPMVIIIGRKVCPGKNFRI